MKSTRFFVKAFVLLVFLSYLTITTFAASDDVCLESITCIGASCVEFSPNVTEYDVYVPYTYTPNNFNSATMPKITAVAKNPHSYVDIVYPDKIEYNKIVITVQSPDKLRKKIYNFNLHLMGKNLYEDGGMESESFSEYWGDSYYDIISYQTTKEKFAGECSLAVDVQSYRDKYPSATLTYGYHRPQTAPVLEKGKKYISSAVVKLADGELNLKNVHNYIPSAFANKACVTYYEKSLNPVSYMKRDYTLTLNDEWTRCFKTIEPREDLALKFDTYTTWNNSKVEPIRYIDECYVGELTINGINITDDLGRESIELNASTLWDTEVQLTARPYNQFGNSIGLENEIVNWSVKGSPEGIEVSKNGLVTVASCVVPGEYIVCAEIIPSFNCERLAKVNAEYVVNISNNQFYYTKNNIKVKYITPGSIVCNLNYTNNGDESEDVKVYDVVYERKDNNEISLYSVSVTEYSVAVKDTIFHKKEVIVPDDGKKYIVKSFIWDEQLKAFMKNGKLRWTNVLGQELIF